MTPSNLERQLGFLVEIDKLKGVIRRSRLIGADRLENSAEHSWHLAMAALVLAEHAAETMDLTRVVQMALVHDIVEIDAGDTYCYDTVGNKDKLERELRAADRIFSLLPEPQGARLRALWDEFEARETPEARYAAALDRIVPLMHNFHTEGRSWREHAITRQQVIERNIHIREGAPALWEYAERMIDQAVENGWLIDDAR